MWGRQVLAFPRAILTAAVSVVASQLHFTSLLPMPGLSPVSLDYTTTSSSPPHELWIALPWLILNFWFLASAGLQPHPNSIMLPTLSPPPLPSLIAPPAPAELHNFLEGPGISNYDTNKTQLDEAPFGRADDDYGPGSEPPPHDRLRYVSTFMPSRRRPPAAVGKPSFPRFKVFMGPKPQLVDTVESRTGGQTRLRTVRVSAHLEILGWSKQTAKLQERMAGSARHWSPPNRSLI
ncbi:hypothetical protein THAOC_28170 [Thalassiosira oceanica]|uniref:Uncharacterized protein n=1 Tax=Thalassiosira oceanica TaxID=159749 RepID=K0RJU7_THAOC|nr:hypothetical protein THAOC_28170 [Thalassiosira oceanica]|eukprot:EJK52539.1 hypothetical protein THAOC_28170 [Thalassiosira oceanica]